MEVSGKKKFDLLRPPAMSVGGKTVAIERNTAGNSVASGDHDEIFSTNGNANHIRYRPLDAHIRHTG